MPIINNGTSFSQPRVAHIAAVIMAALRRHDDGLVEPVPAPQPVPSDRLKTPAQAAQRLGVSIRTLRGLVSSGAVRYVAIGRGRQREKMMFTDADLDDLVASRTRHTVSIAH
jgi:excisionase family DNA binding protein